MIFLFWVSGLSATTFAPVSIESQIRESSAVIVGEYLRGRSARSDNGDIITIHTFLVDKEIGATQNLEQKSGEATIEVLAPGGTIGDLTTLVEGSPRFSINRPSLLFLKSGQTHHWIQNLALGTYDLKTFGGEKLFINPVFPNNGSMGKISAAKMFSLIEKVKGMPFSSPKTAFQKISAPAMTTIAKENHRSPASYKNFSKAPSKTRSKANESDVDYWAIVFGLALLGGMFTLWSQREI